MKPIDLLSPVGFVLLIGRWVLSLSGKSVPGRPEIYWAVGAALIVAHLFLRWNDILDVVGRRQMKYGGNTVALVAAVLAILGTLNYLVVRHTKRWDLTKDQRYSLSDQTKKVLAGLKDDIKILQFDKAANAGPGQDRLKEYQAASPRIKTEFVDPIAKPAVAREYDITMVPTLVVERGKKREKLTTDSEQDVTNALLKVTREGSKTVCFVEGEGEHDPEDSGDKGYSGAKSALEKSQYQTKKVFLLREGKVPADCTILALTGPQNDLQPQATDAIKTFVKGGGKALILVEPEMKQAYPNLAALLKEWNIEAGSDVVVDVSGMGQLFGTGEFTPLAMKYPYHEITRDFREMTAYHTARSMQAGKATIEGTTAQNLVETSPESWAETDLTLKGAIKFDEGKDRKGPISLGAVATIRVAAMPSPAPTPSPSEGEDKKEDTPKAEGRVVAVGDSDYASNQLLGFQGNQDFFLNSVAWLSQDSDLISIRPKEPEDQKMFLTRAQQQLVSLISLILLPGLFVVLGIVSWWRRR